MERSRRISKLLEGTHLRFLSIDEPWTNVQTETGLVGWARNLFLQCLNRVDGRSWAHVAASTPVSSAMRCIRPCKFGYSFKGFFKPWLQRPIGKKYASTAVGLSPIK